MKWLEPPKVTSLGLPKPFPWPAAAAAGGGDDWEQGSGQDKAWHSWSWQRQAAVCMWAFLCFLFLSWSLWLFAAQAPSDAYLVSMSGGSWQHGLFSALSSESDSPTPAFLGTGIYGEEAGRVFRQRLACFSWQPTTSVSSESGAWEYDATPRRLPWNFAGDPFANQCDGRHVGTVGNVAGLQADAIALNGEASDWKVREELRWVWRSNASCPMLPMDRDNLCRLVGANNNILVVGDSINHELQWTLLNNLLMGTPNLTATPPSLSSVRSWQGPQVCEDVLGAGRGFTVGFVRNDRLSAVREPVDDGWSNVLEWPWVPLLRPWAVRVLLLNRGAHYAPDAALAAELDDTLGLLRRLHPRRLLVLLRNTPPGHRGCGDAPPAPLRERQPPADLPPDWHWGEFARQNGLVEVVARRHGVVYVDVDAALSLRADGHIDANDCLHYCLPGPLDHVVHLLYNIFLALPAPLVT